MTCMQQKIALAQPCKSGSAQPRQSHGQALACGRAVCKSSATGASSRAYLIRNVYGPISRKLFVLLLQFRIQRAKTCSTPCPRSVHVVCSVDMCKTHDVENAHLISGRRGCRYRADPLASMARSVPRQPATRAVQLARRAKQAQPCFALLSFRKLGRRADLSRPEDCLIGLDPFCDRQLNLGPNVPNKPESLRST